MKNKYFLGIDIAKNQNSATLKDLKSNQDSFRFDNNLQGYQDLIEKISGKDIIFGLEATGFYHLPLTFWLKDKGYQVRIINPLATRKMAKANIRKTKTDKIDSKHLAWMTQLGEGHLFHESHQSYQLKLLCRHRFFLKRQIERLKKHNQALSFQEGIFVEDEVNFLPDIKEHSEKLISVLEGQIKETTERIFKIAKEIPEIKYLDSIPGISTLLACQILAEIGNIERFSTTKALVAFAGLDSSIVESGESRHSSGKISKRGSPYLRYYLFHGARAAVRSDPELKEYYLKKEKEGKHFFVRLAAVSRKLLLRIYRVLKDKRCYIKSSKPFDTP